MPNVNVGSVLTVTPGTWQNELPNQNVTSVSFAPTTVAGYTYAWNITLSATLTLTPNIGGVYVYVCVDPTWWNSTNGWVAGVPPPHYGIVGVSGNVVTVVGDYDPGNPGDNWFYNTTVTPTIGAAIITAPRIQRYWQWYRGSSPITGATSPVYTLSTADAGFDITVRESGYRWSTPAVTTASTSAAVTAVANAGASTLVFLNNLNYLGAFAIGKNLPYPGPSVAYASQALTINPNGYLGNSTIMITDSSGTLIGEFQIPATLVNSADYNALPNAPIVRTATMIDPTEGQAPAGIKGGGTSTFYGNYVIPGSSKMLTCMSNFYTYDFAGLFWRRPWNLSTTGSVENPFYVWDKNALNASGKGTTPRWTTGAICKIPTTLVNGVNYQTTFGSDVMSGISGLSIASTQSSAPSAICWSTANIDATIAKVNSGTIAAVPSASSITLAGSASGTTDYYKDHLLYISNGPGNTSVARITGYNGSTKVATLTTYGATPSVWQSTTITDAQWVYISPYNLTAGFYLVITTSTQFDFFDATGAVISGVAGMTQLNGNTYYLFGVNGSNQYALFTDKALTTKLDGSAFSTYTSGGTVNATPTTASTYITRPLLEGKQLCGRVDPNVVGGDPPLQPLVEGTISAIWSYGATPRGMVIPDGTRSLMFFGGGSDGPDIYGPVNYIKTGGNTGPLCWDPANTSTGPHNYPYTFRIWAYDLDELAQVYNGTGGKTFYNVLPYGVFTFSLPEGSNGQIAGACYDSATKRIYIAIGNGPYGATRIHVYEVTNAVAV